MPTPNNRRTMTDANDESITATGGRLVTTTGAHYEIHAGNSYQITTAGVVASSSKREIAITTPADVSVHALVDASGGGEFTFEIVEGIGAYTGGSATTPVNRNRQSVNTSSTTAAVGSLTYTGGTVIHSRRLGLGKDGGSDSYDLEWILDVSTRYAFRVTSHASSNPISVLLTWYEI